MFGENPTVKIEGFYDGETLEERLLRLTHEWDIYENDTRCDCVSNAYNKCAEDIKYLLKQLEESRK